MICNPVADPGIGRHRGAAGVDAGAEAIAWVLRGGGITTALIAASKPEQVVDCVGALDRLGFTPDEPAEINRFAMDEAINLWARSSQTER